MTPATNTSQTLVVVTGASSGIGRELALCAARDGHPLLLIARGADALHDTAAAAIEAGSPAAHVLSADLASDAGIDLVCERVEELDLPVAALVNNAGFGVWGPFAEQDHERLAMMVDLNDRAIVVLTRRLLDRIRDAKGGVLTVASTAAYQPGPGMAVYHASKAFALYFSLALRDELRASGIHATALCPGPVPTAFAVSAGLHNMEEMKMARLAAQPADKVARKAWAGLAKNKAVVMPGIVNRIGAFFARVFPLTMVTRIARDALGAVDASGAATAKAHA